MGSAEEGVQGKAALKTQQPDAVVSLAGQEGPTTPSVYPPEWPLAAAYYGGAAGTPPGFFAPSPPPHTYMWPAPHMIAPYGPSLPYPHMYAGMYPHPGMTQGTTVTAVELEGKSADGKDQNSAKPSKDGTGATSGDGVKAICAAEEPSRSGESGETGTEGSTSAGEGEANAQGTMVTGKRSYDKMIGTSGGIQYGGISVEAPGCFRGQPATSIPVPLPGKVAATAPATNLNIGMDIWCAPHPGSNPLKDRPNAASISPSLGPTTIIGQNGVVPMNPQLSAMDERELKRQRRKQSNRESARRSRLRKQFWIPLGISVFSSRTRHRTSRARVHHPGYLIISKQECEDLAKKVEELTAENGQLRNEIDHLKELCKKLQSENAAIKEELSEIGGQGMLSALEMKSSLARATNGDEDPRGLQTTEGNGSQANGKFLRSNGSH